MPPEVVEFLDMIPQEVVRRYKYRIKIVSTGVAVVAAVVCVVVSAAVNVICFTIIS